MSEKTKKAKSKKSAKQKPVKSSIRRFRDRNISPLASHSREGKTLKNPFSTIGAPLTPRSWVNECIPNILWACILTAVLDRTHYLRLFRTVAINIREQLENYSKLFISHNFISRFSEQEFDIAFGQVLADADAKSALSALLIAECLPDRKLWEARLQPPTEEHWRILAKAVALCFDHQSEKSTDIRWIKLTFLAITGRIQFAKQQEDMLESLRLYPDHGDMRVVRHYKSNRIVSSYDGVWRRRRI